MFAQFNHSFSSLVQSFYTHLSVDAVLESIQREDERVLSPAAVSSQLNSFGDAAPLTRAYVGWPGSRTAAGVAATEVKQNINLTD